MGELSKSRILITGGAGFLSQHLCNKALKKYDLEKVFLLDVNPNFNNFLDLPKGKIDYFQADINDAEIIESLIKKINPTHVFHNAAVINHRLNFEELENSIRSNFFGTFNLLSALKNIKLKCLLFTSTSEVYGDNSLPFREDLLLKPTSPYSISKASTEMLVRNFSIENNLPYVIVRPFNMYGEGQSNNMLIPYLFNSIIKNETINVTKGEQTRDSNYVGNICDGILMAVSTEIAKGHVINLCSGFELSVKDLVKKIIAISGFNAKVNYGAIPYRKNEIWRMFGDNSKSEELINWKPLIGLDKGLLQTFKWYQRNVKD
ncbi:MAG: hypothetical protein CME68_01915 [Halobacteriovoraceae bacterium]|nr:hypothetical protein [Halobacteriovoraceae bacterium]|tara:strand:- start:741 stop:1694 length:954 start_codon:yes stop_codon:yes gene_type:complete